ncbi:MAG: HD domain-containing protein [Deltaproteobacteria bacterium]|jgi:HD-GYP domain-containing protein (c-di-GMP phosphodiesterase class II)|nr:HD domain-containing protein [Deltaproteobacteria bacterium]
MSDARIYNSRIIDTYLKLIMARYPHVDIDRLVRMSGMESYEIADQGTWFTQKQVNRFYELVVQATGNENIAREAGRYGASPDTLGSMRQYLIALFGPAKAFALISKLAENLTKSADFYSRALSANSVEVIVRPRPGVQEELFQCQNRIGYFEMIVTIFYYKAPVIEHEECIFQGGEACRYLIRWQPSSTSTIKQIRDLYVGAMLAGNLIAAMTQPGILPYFAPSSLTILFGLNWWLESSRKKRTESTLDQLHDSAEQLNEQINVNYRNTQLTREIGEAITSQKNIDDVITTIAQVLKNTLDYDRVLILLADEDSTRLEIRGGYGYTEKHLEILEGTSFRLDNPKSQGPFVVSFRQQKPLLINDASEISSQVTPRSRKFMEAMNTKSFLTVPIILQDESIGILAVDNYQRNKPLVNADVNLLMGLASTIGISFRNAALNEAREDQFAATLKVLAHSIDARDFLTAGHSEKVAEYATAIASELGKSHEYCQMIRIAALLHDYGKIGVPDTVLKKDGPLTDAERALIRTHSEKSRDILEQVPFEGVYEEIPLIALYHHEKWDGSGYPEGLAGNKIPLGARIVAIADFFEAITAKRHYREPMPTDVAIDLLRRESGAHFDPQIVAVFLRYLDRIKNQDGHSGSLGPKDIFLPKLRDPRYPLEAKVKAQIGELVVNGQTVDISQGGAFLHIDEQVADQIKRFASAKLTVNLHSAKEIEIEGQVRWVNQNDGRLSSRHPVGIGLAFLNIDAQARRLLHRTLLKLRQGAHKHQLTKPLVGA